MRTLGYFVRLRRRRIGWAWLVTSDAEVLASGYRLTRRRALRAAVAFVRGRADADSNGAAGGWRAREHTDELGLSELLDLAAQLTPHPKENP